MAERADDDASVGGSPGQPAESGPAPARNAGESPPRAAGSARTLPIPEECRRCLGLLYYSSTLLEERKEPVCVGLRRSVDPSRSRARGGPAEARPSGEFRYVCWGCADYDAAGLHRSAGRPPAPGDAPLPRCIGIEAVAAARARVEGGRGAVGRDGPGREGAGEDGAGGRGGLPGAPGDQSGRGPNAAGNESEARRFLERFQVHAARIAARMVYNAVLIGEYAQKGVENVLGKGGEKK